MARRRNERPVRKHRKRVVVASEGATERRYIASLIAADRSLAYTPVSVGKQGSVKQLLRKMRGELQKYPLEKGEHAWIILDGDTLDSSGWDMLSEWMNGHANHHVLVSNPCFETWLTLHFDPHPRAKTAAQALDEVRKYVPTYSKGQAIKAVQDTLRPLLSEAVRNAQAREQATRAPGVSLYEQLGCSQIYEFILAYEIIAASEGP
ncbi:RloB family protein [Actinotignum timonense]|uniref:RloB family protein n=1 Tax=Actinotignum timonense TaxID=1870995 RepID=UPI00254C6CEE|nr:RloB family protein [Actinotignum timonense]MDK8781930.1 RloB family protein [Actinotignum timonense]